MCTHSILNHGVKVSGESGDTHESPGGDFRDVHVDGPVVAAEVDRSQLVLGTDSAELCLVFELV